MTTLFLSTHQNEGNTFLSSREDPPFPLRRIANGLYYPNLKEEILVKTRLPWLTPEKGFIFRITHIKNIPWILEHGLHCQSSSVQDPNYTQIGRPEIIQSRDERKFEHGGKVCLLKDYVPFYFTPRSPMLLNIKTGWDGLILRPMEEVVFIVSSFQKLKDNNVEFLFSDRNACLKNATFSSDPKDLQQFVPWADLQNSNFMRDPNRPENVERYMAEALVHKHLPVGGIEAIVCQSEKAVKTVDVLVKKHNLVIRISAQAHWYP